MRTIRKMMTGVGFVALALSLALVGCGGQQQTTDSETETKAEAEAAATEEQESQDTTSGNGVWVKAKQVSKSTYTPNDTKGEDDEHHVSITETEFELDEHGNVISETTRSTYDGQDMGSGTTVYTIDENGYRLSRANLPDAAYMGDISKEREREFPSEKYRNTFDDEGRIVRTTVLEREGDLGVISTYQVGEDGEAVGTGEELSKDAKDPTYKKSGSYIKYGYDEDGHINRIKTVDVSQVSPEGEDKAKEQVDTSTRISYYGEHGLIERTTAKLVAVDGSTTRIKTNVVWEPADSDSPATQTITYDNGDIVTSSFEYDENGNIASMISDAPNAGVDYSTHTEFTYEWVYIDDPSPAVLQATSIFNRSSL